eukprot:Protomagalhaensia_wolfi_Nauph_80__1678@NODE_203_length_3195_cov_39_308935_g152_i0_p4_GENE_NODE_203_length_3195_cov_39_308935_g152_i0NODE_203_length_3195_cov_39_308935_g152_i0_p4_ORF_typecomplete_len107_score22_93_NODE_203_length_3195_cov_39_308935_g152_i098418
MTFSPPKSNMVATPAPGLFAPQGGPAWQFSRHFLSAASSPNSGPLASAPTSPFPFIRSGDTPNYSRMFAPPITAPHQNNHPLSNVLLKDGKVVTQNEPSGFKLVRL